MTTPFLDAIAGEPAVTPADLLRGRPLVVLAPHPDDETLGCGALLFDAAAAGVPVSVICVTDGGQSHPGSRAWPPPRLARERQQELAGALGILAPHAAVHWLGHPEGSALAGRAIVEDVAALVPRRALLLATWWGDPHRDHQQVATLARSIATRRPDLILGFYPIWGRFGDQPAPAVLLHSSAPARSAKRRALACHRTQMSDLVTDAPDGFRMEDWRQEHFLQHPEILIAA